MSKIPIKENNENEKINTTSVSDGKKNDNNNTVPLSLLSPLGSKSRDRRDKDNQKGTKGTEGTKGQKGQDKYKDIYNKLNNKLKILYYIIDNQHNISEIAEKTNLLKETIKKIIQRDDGEFYNKSQDVPAKFKATQTGIKELELIWNEEEYKRLEEKIQNEKVNDFKSKLDMIKEFCKNNPSELIDFNQLAKFNPNIANWLLDEPEECMKAFEISFESQDVYIKPRFKNLPKSQILMISEIRNHHINKLYSFEGTIRHRTDVRPQVISARFECPSCGNVIPTLASDGHIKEPNRCGCGRKGKFRLLSEERTDAFSIKLEELSEQLSGQQQPKNILISITGDLCESDLEKNLYAGTNIKITGIIKPLNLYSKRGKKADQELLILANNIEILDDVIDLKISKQNEKKIKELANDPELLNKLKKTIAPSICGFKDEKEGIILQLIGGDHATKRRKQIHILLIGDPSTGKSVILRESLQLAPKGRFVSSEMATGSGLTASAVKDELMGGWAVQAGALVLSNKGVCGIDELDKLSDDDKNKLHGVMEQGEINFSKANIQAKLNAKTSILAGANPKFGRFDPHEPISEQFNFPPTLLSRFDLIFTIRDNQDEKKDSKIAEHILNEDEGKKKEIIDQSLLRKYIAYAKKHECTISKEAKEILKNFYLIMRNKSDKSLAIATRQLESLKRLTIAYARLKLKKEAGIDEAYNAVKLFKYSLSQLNFSNDIDIIELSFSTNDRNKIMEIKHIINDIEKRVGRLIPITEIQDLAKIKGFSQDDVDNLLIKLKEVGDIYEPKKGYIAKLE